MPQTPRQRFLGRLLELKKARSPWDERFREAGDYLQPWRVRFNQNERVKRTASDKILDPTGTYAVRTCAAGLSAGICSPARRWKRHTVSDPRLNEVARVKDYLWHVEQVTDWILLQSGFYGVTSGSVFTDMVTFGTSGTMTAEDPRAVVRWNPLAMGQYWLASSARGEIDSIYVEDAMTVGQEVEEFGLDAVSPQVRDQFRRGQYDVPHTIVQCVEPNRRDDETGFGGMQCGRFDWKGMEWRSVWMEVGNPDAAGTGFLRCAGFHDFPALTPRWGRTQPKDVYGTGPGFEALPDVKQLQTMKRRLLQIIEKQAAPALTGPSSLKIPSQLPGSYTPMDGTSTQRVEPIYVPDAAAVREIREEIQELRYAIREGLFADLWRVITDDERAQRSTAEEVRAKREERLLLLGPVVTNVEEEYLRRAIDRVYNMADRAGYLPQAPPELDGVELKIEFMSIMSEAQKAQQIPSVERTAAFILSLSQIDPDVLDDIDGDKFAERYAEVAGLPPDLLRTPEARDARRQARRQAQQAQQQGAAMAQAASSAKDLSGASLESDNGLSRILNTMSPTAGVQAGTSLQAPFGGAQ